MRGYWRILNNAGAPRAENYGPELRAVCSPTNGTLKVVLYSSLAFINSSMHQPRDARRPRLPQSLNPTNSQGLRQYVRRIVDLVARIIAFT